MNSLLERTLNAAFGGYIQNRVDRAVLAAVKDTFEIAGAGPKLEGGDIAWSNRLENLEDALEAWRINPYARRAVNLATSHIIGRGLSIANDHPDINAWLHRFWHHRKNKIGFEIYELTDELTRAGEWFFLLFTNPQDGMQYIRAIPARWVIKIETDPDDYKRPLKYWIDTGDPDYPEGKHYPPADDADPMKPAVVHYAVNRPVGAVRSWGGDLDPMLPNLRRYTNWLRDRVKINQNRNAWVWKMQAADKTRVGVLEEKYKAGIPSGSTFIHTPNEDLQTVSPQIDASDAKADGEIFRQAIAVGANVPPYMISDTLGTTRATARESSLPTYKFWETRQLLIVQFLQDLVQVSIHRARASNLWRRRHNQRLPEEGNWSWTHTVADLTREDNRALAAAAKTIVDALAVMKREGWIDNQSAITWASRFAGESLDPDIILERLENPPGGDGIERDEHAAMQAELANWLVRR